MGTSSSSSNPDLCISDQVCRSLACSRSPFATDAYAHRASKHSRRRAIFARHRATQPFCNVPRKVKNMTRSKGRSVFKNMEIQTGRARYESCFELGCITDVLDKELRPSKKAFKRWTRKKIFPLEGALAVWGNGHRRRII